MEPVVSSQPKTMRVKRQVEVSVMHRPCIARRQSQVASLKPHHPAITMTNRFSEGLGSIQDPARSNQDPTGIQLLFFSVPRRRLSPPRWPLTKDCCGSASSSCRGLRVWGVWRRRCPRRSVGQQRLVKRRNPDMASSTSSTGRRRPSGGVWRQHWPRWPASWQRSELAVLRRQYLCITGIIA